jgi:predicted nucleic acid-binding protein
VTGLEPEDGGEAGRVLVDSSVWIGFFRGLEADVVLINDLIRGRSRVLLAGTVVQEVLQGIRAPAQRSMTARMLSRFPCVYADWRAHVGAADLYAELRTKGVTVPAADALIATLALREEVPLCTRDRHFMLIAEHRPLEVRTPGRRA